VLNAFSQPLVADFERKVRLRENFLCPAWSRCVRGLLGAAILPFGSPYAFRQATAWQLGAAVSARYRW
jgi:hypothetical protein